MFSNRDLKKLLIPLIIEQLLSVLVGMADVVMVAEVGEAAVSGVSLVDAINLLIIQCLAALATGGAVVAGQALGFKGRKAGLPVGQSAGADYHPDLRGDHGHFPAGERCDPEAFIREDRGRRHGQRQDLLLYHGPVLPPS